MQLESGPTGIIKATAVFTGLAGAATGAPDDIDERSLVDELASLGRRMLGLRQPPRRSEPRSRVPKRIEHAPGRWKDFLAEA
jgi:hypothetical protein